MMNTIILLHGNGEISEKGDTIFGNDSYPDEVKRWNISEDADAQNELDKHKCEYWKSSTFYGFNVLIADEWALKYCECDEDGECIQAGDFYLAKEKKQ